jgi:hypothetical protein
MAHISHNNIVVCWYKTLRHFLSGGYDMRKLAVILCVLFLPTISYATPSIGDVGGMFYHGNFITITGTGFGPKSPAKPLVWADFENGSVSEIPSLSTGSLTRSGEPSYVIGTKNLPHARSTKNVYGMANTGGTKTASTIAVNYSGSPSYYFFVRRKFPEKTFSTTSNLKLAHGYPPSGTGINTTFNYHNFSNPYDPNYANQGLGIVHQWGEGIGPYTKLDDSGAWATWEYQEGRGSIDIRNGTIKFWVNSILKRNSNILNRTTKYSAINYTSIQITNYWQTSVTGATYPVNGLDYIDDLYIDQTWARVMIGNAPTFDACTRREPLIPTEWSSSSITAYFNQGAFQNGEKVYIFVVDSGGNPSLGKGITIGGVAQSLIPTSPSMLSISQNP